MTAPWEGFQGGGGGWGGGKSARGVVFCGSNTRIERKNASNLQNLWPGHFNLLNLLAENASYVIVYRAEEKKCRGITLE